MEKFKKQIIVKIVICVVFVVLTAAVYAGMYTLFANEDSFSAGYGMGFFAGLVVVVLAYAVRYGSILKDPEKLKKLYILENDERYRLIREKTASGSFTATVLILGLATAVATFFSTTVSCVLAGVIGVIAVIKMSFRFYYSRKY